MSPFSAQIHAPHVGEHVPHAELLAAMRLQERRELSGVEVVGVVGDRFELGGRDGLGREAVVADPALRAHRVAEAAAVLARQPVRHEVQLAEALRKHQRVIVAVVGGARSSSARSARPA